MKRSDWLWILIRLLGVYLLTRAIFAVPNAIGGIVAANAFRIFATMGDDALAEMHKAFFFKSLIDVFRLVIYSLLAWYFLRGGKWFHRFITPKDAPADTEND
jgi:hypothetical protein